MRFSNFLPSTRLNRLQLLDIAIVMAFLPLLFLLKLPMLVYIFTALFFIMKKKTSKLIIYSFMFLGLISISISFFSEYNFSSFSKLLVFISLLISILTYAVILQRLTRQINIYLLLSPSMLMILSFFFYNSIEMLFYALFTLFSFSFLLLYDKMQGSFKNTLRINILLYLFSLPIVTLLFLVFPRISYKDASFGFKGEDIKRTGHDGTMFIDSTALLVPSSKLVMEVSFKKDVPSANHLYFRGSTLYTDKGNQWVAHKARKVNYPRVKAANNVLEYNIKLYPHQKRWLYMLDIPILSLKDTYVDEDYITLSKKPLFEVFQYKGKSALQYISLPSTQDTLEKALVVDPKRDPKTSKKLLEAIDINEKDRIKAQQLLVFFKKADLSYSLQPKEIDLEHPLDSFLWDSKVGYCVHFASSFATSARLLNIPSRIVTGYKADRSNAINNYLLVREADAHAWVELYLQDRGWVRFEPTSTASRILRPKDRSLSNSYTNASFENSALANTLKQLNMHYLYTRHLINTWILQYDRNKQVSILKKIFSDTLFLFKIVGSFLAFALLCIFLFFSFSRGRHEDKYLHELNTIIKTLKKQGFERDPGESIFHFFSRLEGKMENYEKLQEVGELYHLGRYAKTSDKTFTLFKEKIKAYKKRT